MEFLVHIETELPPDRRDEIVAAERRRGEELRAAGTLRRIWRIPGTRANYGLWEAEDGTALHGALSSLPAFPWARIEVVPLARHPLEGGPHA